MSVSSEYCKTQSKIATDCCQICVIIGEEMSADGLLRNPQCHHRSRKIMGHAYWVSNSALHKMLQRGRNQWAFCTKSKETTLNCTTLIRG